MAPTRAPAESATALKDERSIMEKQPSRNKGGWKYLVLAITLACTLGTARAGTVFHCSFARGAWDPNRWMLVKSPRWSHFGGWVQKDDCIENETPADAAAKDLLGKRAPETYTSMVLKRTFSGNVVVRSTMEFTDRMAPLIVLAPTLGKAAKGRPEYREHYEVVLYDGGINVWHHSKHYKGPKNRERKDRKAVQSNWNECKGHQEL